MLEESGPKSWSDALEIVRQHHIDHHKSLERIANSTQKAAQCAANWTTSKQSKNWPRKLSRNARRLSTSLTRIKLALDEEADFFREYSPKQLEEACQARKRLRCAVRQVNDDLTILREACILRDKLRGRQRRSRAIRRWRDRTMTSTRRSESAHGAEEFDFAELDRGDVERSRRKNVRLRTAAGRQFS